MAPTAVSAADLHDTDRAVAYCFGDLPPSELDVFEQHLLGCDDCWAAVHPLARATHVIRTDRIVRRTLLAPDVVGILGMSGALARLFAGHARFVVPMSLAYAALYGVACAAGAGYTLREQSREIATLMIAAVPTMLGVALISFQHTVQQARTGRTGLGIAAATHILCTMLLCLYLVPNLPSAPTVTATFQPSTAQAAYLKSVAALVVLFLPFTLAPFQAIVSLQHELRRGRWTQVLSLLSGDHRAVPHHALLFPRVRVLSWLLLLIAVKAVFGVQYLFGGLVPDDQMALFMFLVLLRVVAWFAIAAVALRWYARSLNELKREALAMQLAASSM